MSILIKGMKMPDKCSECKFFRVHNRLYCTAVVGYTTVSKPHERRPTWCPLVDLGKHGDLIDRDAFKADYGMKDDCADCEKEMRGKVKACEYDRVYSKMDFCGWLDDADVVIEAEDSE